jgi:hypothetical protein
MKHNSIKDPNFAAKVAIACAALHNIVNVGPEAASVPGPVAGVDSAFEPSTLRTYRGRARGSAATMRNALARDAHSRLRRTVPQATLLNTYRGKEVQRCIRPWPSWYCRPWADQCQGGHGGAS